MGNAGFDDEGRPDLVDDLLDPEHVLGKLDDGPSHPGETVDILGVPAHA